MPRGRCYRESVGLAVVLILLIASTGRLFAGSRLHSSTVANRAATSPSRRVSSSSKKPEQRLQLLRRGDSSRQSRKRTISVLPLDKLTADQRRRARQILRSSNWFHELPTLSFSVSGETYDYFLDHPHIAVAIWQVMGISKFHMRPIGKGRYHADAGDGTVGTIEVLLRNKEETLVICEGVYTNILLFRPIKARALLSVKHSFFRDANGKPLVKHRASLFVSFPSYPVRTVAKIVSPLSNIMIDRNFQEVSLFLHTISLAMQKQPGWIEHLANKRNDVLRTNRDELLELTARVYVAYRKQQMAEHRPNPNGELKSILKAPPMMVTGSPNRENSLPRPPRVATSPMSDRTTRTE